MVVMGLLLEEVTPLFYIDVNPFHVGDTCLWTLSVSNKIGYQETAVLYHKRIGRLALYIQEVWKEVCSVFTILFLKICSL